ncbi:MAG: hypothetical protein AUH81_21120 [Candidatus Rokubacteria bacterium 13_1_40CM_4_69_5]|nr:MAG: hypothetical protein AUH81_21120 [Candidatus Rokubacteria bacterium 13_1_40CM_4_69_5]
MGARAAVDPDHVVLTEPVPGSDIPVHLMYVPEGRFPIVLLASGNGGGGMPWVREAVRNRGFIMERLLRAGYAVAWLRYRAEVELGYNTGGRLVEDIRQGRQLLNRAPLEYEDEIDVVKYVKTLPFVDPNRVGLAGVSHGGEMIFKLTSEYHGVAAGVACEPANHEFLDLTPDETAHVKPETQLRDIEEMQMRQVAKVRARINEKVARERIRTIRTPILVLGREDDHAAAGGGQGRGMGLLRPSDARLSVPGPRRRRRLCRGRDPGGGDRGGDRLLQPPPEVKGEAWPESDSKMLKRASYSAAQ